MKCPFCSSRESKVVDKRTIQNGEVNWRRRECLKCGKRYTTYERIRDINLFIRKKDGSKEPFQRKKLKKGIEKACEKRPVSEKGIDQIVEDIEGKLRAMDTTKVNSQKIGEMVMKKLKKLDKVAYVRFASVYKDFKDVKSFKKELDKLKENL